jgi:putative transcriptional regulator
MAKSKLMDVIHGTAVDCHKAGIMNEQTMRKFDVMCLPKVKDFSPNQIIRLRKKNKASQAVFAAYLNTTASTIQNWEQGQKKPSRLALKLLNLIDRHGLALLAA